MSVDSIVALSPIDGGDPISIPCEKTVIGRGSLLQITDKRVSRNHATLEVCDGKLVIVPIHTNPCFYKPNDSKASVVLQKDKPKTLLHGDVISLLPDKLLYKIVYRNNPEKCTESEVSPKESNEAGEENTAKEDAPVVQEKKDLDLQPEKPSPEVAKKEEESNNGRHLPDWMVGAASRLKLKDASSKVKNGQSSNENKTSRPKASTQHKAKKLDYCDDEEEDNKDDESDAKNNNDDDDDDDDDDDKWSSKKSSKRKSSPPRSKNTRKTSSRRRHSDDDDDDDVGGKRRKRIPRAATQKTPKYTDDDFVMSDEEFVIEEDESEQSKGEDSDFVMDDADSGSDWDNKGKSKGKSRSGKGRSSSRVRRGRYNSEEVSEEDDDDYKPRSTKKRNTSTRKRKRRDSEDEDDDDNEDDDDDYRGSRRKAVKRKHTPKTKKRSTGGKKRRRSEDEKEDENGIEEEEEEKPSPKKAGPKNKRKKNNEEDEEEQEEVEGDEKSAKSKKVPCQFGAECYRKNSKHLEEFSHPSEKSKSEETEDLNAPRQKRAAALKQKEKLEAMHEASEDDEEMQEELAA